MSLVVIFGVLTVLSAIAAIIHLTKGKIFFLFIAMAATFATLGMGLYNGGEYYYFPTKQDVEERELYKIENEIFLIQTGDTMQFSLEPYYDCYVSLNNVASVSYEKNSTPRVISYKFEQKYRLQWWILKAPLETKYQYVYEFVIPSRDNILLTYER